MFERLRFMHRLATQPSRQTCNAAVLVITGRQSDVQRAPDRIAQHRKYQP